MEKVKVISTVNNRVGVESEDLRFKRTWAKKGASVQIDKEVLEELMFDDGFRYMIETGMLYIEDMEVKKELGIEPEDAEEPTNIIVLDEKQMRHYMVAMSLTEFKEKIQELNYEQMQALADFAIENRLTNIDKCKVVKEICGKDIIRAIQLNDLDKGE